MTIKYGVWSGDQIRELENKIIRHAAKVKVLTRASVERGRSQFEHDHDLENRLIIKTKGESIGGSIRGGRLTEEGQMAPVEHPSHRRLETFNTRPPRMGNGSGSSSSNGGTPDHDDYSDEGGA